MTTLDHATPMTQAAARPAILERAGNAVSNLFRAWKNRREFYRLGEMSDAELSDIGLTRGDLHVADRLPFASDPTASLGTMANARAHSLEAAARRVS